MNFFFIKHFRWLLLRFGNYKLISLNLSKILITLKSKKILMPWSSSSSWVHNSLSNSLPNPGQSEKIKLNFYFRTSLWCLKRFYEGLHKTFWGSAKKREKKKFNWIFSLSPGLRREGLGKIQALTQEGLLLKNGVLLGLHSAMYILDLALE